MGTRNITFVVQDGEKRVAQYCQWDGYPTGRGADVLLFVKDVLQGGVLPTFEEKIRLSSLTVVDAEENRTYTGAPYNSERGKLLGMVEAEQYKAGHNFVRTVMQMMESGRLSREAAAYAVVASRDVGNEVLEFLMAVDGSMEFYADDYVYNMPPEGDWQIEGVYIIDLDKKTVEIWYHERRFAVSFSDLEKMAADDIYELMKLHEQKG